MIELFELFNKINNLQSSLSFESQPRYARPLTRFDSIHRLDAKSLILNTASMDSTNSAHSILGGPPLDPVRLAAGQARYRRMGYRLGPLQLKVNPGSEGLAGRSTWSQDAARHDPSQRAPSCDKESVLHGTTLLNLLRYEKL